MHRFIFPGLVLVTCFSSFTRGQEISIIPSDDGVMDGSLIYFLLTSVVFLFHNPQTNITKIFHRLIGNIKTILSTNRITMLLRHLSRSCLRSTSTHNARSLSHWAQVSIFLQNLKRFFN